MPMPATTSGISAKDGTQHASMGRFVIGVDGCPAGWAAVRLNLFDGGIAAFITKNFAGLLRDSGADAAMIMVDMPIGLASEGKRGCEVLARKLLKPLRHASVFSSPRRPMLDFETYGEANAWGKRQQAIGVGLSKQAWMIAPKIAEIDAAITSADQARLGEGHPEVAFARLNGGTPCAHAKKKPEGRDERRCLLESAGITNADALFDALRAEVGAGKVARDDVYDACAMALTAKARLDGNVIRLSDDARDARGLLMEIWG